MHMLLCIGLAGPQTAVAILTSKQKNIHLNWCVSIVYVYDAFSWDLINLDAFKIANHNNIYPILLIPI